MTPSPPAPAASIVIPTRERPDYLKVALASIVPQASAAQAETIVVDDGGPSVEGRLLAERSGARYVPHDRPRGLNAARNTGVQRSRGELVVFVDDDVDACDGWLAALLDRAREHPDAEVFAGRIVPRLEGRPPRTCGREGPPVTSLQLGDRDTETRYAWGANMAIRRSALEQIGEFDTTLENGGDEQEWQDRLHARGGKVLYVAAATVRHRRTPRDARLRALARAAFARGRAARRFDCWRGAPPSRPRELATLLGCLAHVLRRRCPAGWVMVAHSAGRLRESVGRGAPAHRGALAPQAQAASEEDFLSGESGMVAGLRGRLAGLLDLAEDGLRTIGGERRRLGSAARREPPSRRVLALTVERPEHRARSRSNQAELRQSRHRVELRVGAPLGKGKFENLNELLDHRAPEGFDWLLVLDDDVALPHGFLDRFLFLCERFRFDLAQPAHARASHAAWKVTRRRFPSVARETRFVEIGPVTAFSRRTLSILAPFPALRMGWGLDLHWAALAAEHGWRCGVIDALAIRHLAAPVASAYSRAEATAEARRFLEERPHLSAREAQRTLATHRRW